jgi:cystathionine beta-lyase
MALYGNHHTPFATVSEAARRCSITFAAPTKTFNIAGLVSSYAIVPDEQLRERFFPWMSASELDAPTLFAMVATEAAFTQGEPWREQMLQYVEQNIDFVADYMAEHHPQIRVIKPQASFLVWIDFSALGLSHAELVDFMVNRARLAMNDGAMFGEQGKQFMRMNVGLSRSVLQSALQQLSAAIATL